MWGNNRYEDTLRAQGVQMMARYICDLMEGNDGGRMCFFREDDNGVEVRATSTPQQLLDAVRRFTASTDGARTLLNEECELWFQPVWECSKGRYKIKRINIIRKRNDE